MNGSRRLCVLALVLLAGCSQAGPSLSTPASAQPSPAPSASALWLSSAAVAVSPAPVEKLPGDPDPRLTPGATNPDVTQDTTGSTICVTGWTATIRPSSSYTTGLKREQVAAYGYSDSNLADYEEDHLIPLELGGAPSDPRNLWPEPYDVTLADGTPVGARVKDQLENKLKALVCAGTLLLADARRAIATDWVGAWFTYLGGGVEPSPVPLPAPATASSAPSAAASTEARALTVTIASVTSPVSRGATATLVAETEADAACSIVVRYKSGPSSAQGLSPASADPTGRVAWTWTVGSRTSPGTWPITVACSAAGSSVTTQTTFVVQ